MSDDQLCGLAVVLDGSEHEVAAAHWAANWAEHSHHHLSLIEPSELVSAQTSSQRHRARRLAGELRCNHPGLTVDHRILDGLTAGQFLASVRRRLEAGMAGAGL